MKFLDCRFEFTIIKYLMPRIPVVMLFVVEFLANSHLATLPVYAADRDGAKEKSTSSANSSERDVGDSKKKRNESQGDNSDPLKPLKDELDQIRSRNDDLRKQIDNGRGHQETLDLSLRKFKSNLEKLSREIEELKKWQHATFVLGESRSTDAAAVRVDGERFVLIGTATGRDVRNRVSAAMTAGVVRVATEDGRKLARRVASATNPGADISDTLVAELRKYAWMPHTLLPVASDGDLKFVVFRDAQKSRQQIGIVDRVDPDTLWYQPVGRVVKSIARSRIEPGSVRADIGNDILDAVDGDDTFLDYCILNLAQQLTRVGREPGHMAVGIHVGLDGMSGSLDIEKRRTGDQIKIDFWRLTPWLPFSTTFDLSRDIPDKNSSLKQIARGIEDALYTKLIESGFPIVEKEHVEYLRKAQEKSPNIPPGPHLNATHLIVADVDKASRKGLYRLTIRLLDVRTGKPIWTIDSEPTRPKLFDQNPFFLKSGTLASVTIDKDSPASKTAFSGFEEPLKVSFSNVGIAAKPPTQHLEQFQSWIAVS